MMMVVAIRVWKLLLVVASGTNSELDKKGDLANILAGRKRKEKELICSLQ